MKEKGSKQGSRVHKIFDKSINEVCKEGLRARD